MKVYLNIRAQ